jgi:molecular chaperone DnaK
VTEAEKNREADAARREFVDLRNRADGLIYSTERTLDEFEEAVRPESRADLEASIAATRKAMEAGDAAALRVAVDELSALTYKMTETLYAELGGEDSK